MIDEIKKILKNSSDDEISENIMKTYLAVEKDFYTQKWKISELESGHFVESVRRFLEYKLFPQYTPFIKSIGSFNNQVLNQYEQSAGLEEYRIIIPRVLYSMYCIRNKRGVGHISAISPNHQDSIQILMSCKWVLAEIIRIESKMDPNSTIGIINKLTNRQIEAVWENGTIRRILVNELSIKEQILVLLYDKSPSTFKELLNNIECKNATYFKKVLRLVHRDRKINFEEANGICILSPKGELDAENIIMKKCQKESL